MRPNHGSLDRFLGDAAELGKLDSQGSFTIAGEAAIGKLASFQLPRKSAWVLKLVQAAVTSGAPSLAITQSRKTTTFTFQPRCEIDISDLQQALTEVEHSAPAPIAHLATGLRAVGFGDRRAFTLALETDGHRELFGWNLTQLARQSEAQTNQTSTTITLGVAFPAEESGWVLGGLMRSAGRVTDEYLELLTSCEACPIPVTLDGRRLDNLNASRKEPGGEIGTTALLSLGWPTKGNSASELPNLSVPQGIERSDQSIRVTDRFEDSRLFFFAGEESVIGASVLIRLNYHFKIDSHRSKNSSFKFTSIAKTSYCHWVLDGVVCHRDVLLSKPFATSADIYLSAEGLSTDLSGLTLGDAGERKYRMLCACPEVAIQAKRTMEAIKDHVPRPFSLHTALYGTLGIFALLAVPTSAGKSMVGAVVAVNAALSAYDKNKIMSDCLVHLERLTAELTLRNRKLSR